MPPAPLPACYTRLAPFRAAFDRGLPILTYHKLGPRPRGARLKGLFVSARLLDRQLAELRQAGFRSASLDDFPAACRPGSRRIVVTFDDGFRNVLDHGLDLLDRHGFTAVQFLVADRIGAVNDWDAAEGEVQEPLMDDAGVRRWLAAGHAIGSHTLTHPRLTILPPAGAREEITASRRRLEDRFGVAVRHFCYPYGDFNETVRDLVQEAGYATACTVENGLNQALTDPFALHRFTARYASRNLKRWVGRFRAVILRRRQPAGG
ncbi:MAG: polysaccharide deacetylase family protein [Verrucomicrobiales bacterium]|nr:polysaccharide deacetylase family protein [Verrucomicrobiales bacterium]